MMKVKATIDKSLIQTKSFGGEGGSEFPLTLITEIGLRTGDRVDQITINGHQHGKNSGKDKGSLVLAHNEYISKVEIRSGLRVDNVSFTTNHHRHIGGGGNGGSPETLNKIRVMAIGGKSGEGVDKLTIMYVNDYRPSKIHKQNVGFILGYAAPFQEFEEYTSSEIKILDSYERVTERAIQQEYSASVEAEYYVKVAASTKIALKDSTLETIRKEIAQEMKSSSKKTIKIPEDHVGILLVQGTIMKGSDDKFWMFPTTAPSYSIIKISDVANVLDHYDLTGELYTQMPGLRSHKKNENGYVYYS